MKLDDSLLVAYVDGELDSNTIREVEAALATDPEARQMVRALRESASMLQAAMNDPLHEAVPDRLLVALEQPHAAPIMPTGTPPALRSANDNWRIPSAVAAMALLLFVGLGSGWYAADLRDESMAARLAALEHQDARLREQARLQILETMVSGQSGEWYNPDSGNRGTISPVRTYKDKKDRYCREFREQLDVDGRRETLFGVACREKESGWTPIMEVRPLVRGQPDA
ncbi:RT0821/Lpp0805 family surface protein [Magnetospira sp. QH-2]|uniref:RT0821/Lpp0805 family surface protein n=1 Tax=Magnetospira sp. (strain QH-2) TaxID=1288970 RepID=UPI0003E81AD6|nr:RT0821/Lpp0805 family surface protein [Magnetospira sp. QH-2]CCQ73344.1 Protein of unknown function [Magnetospira sp. QH-2]